MDTIMKSTGQCGLSPHPGRRRLDRRQRTSRSELADVFFHRHRLDLQRLAFGWEGLWLEPAGHRRRAGAVACRPTRSAAWEPATSNCWPASAPGCTATHTLYAFVWTTVDRCRHGRGDGRLQQSHQQALGSVHVDLPRNHHDPRSSQCRQIAADRKPSMMLLPYGIPMAVGTIAYFAWSGLLI